MKIRSGCIVELDYELRNDEGEVVESSKEGDALVYLHGNDEIPPGLERQLDGVEEGAMIEVTLAPGEAYGDYNPDGIVSVPRSEFPEDAEIVPGDWISVQIAEENAEGVEQPGEEMEMRVMEISPDAIVLDANHPLAGQAVTFDLKVVSVREASEQELAAHRTDKDGE